MTLSEVVDIGYFFLQDIPDFTVGSPGIGAGMRVRIAVDGTYILDEMLYGDGEGNVSLLDMPSLLSAYMSSGYHSISVNGESFNVFYSRNEIRELSDAYHGLYRVWLESNCLSVNQENIVADDEPVYIWMMSSYDVYASVRLMITYLRDNEPKQYISYTTVRLTANTPFPFTTSMKDLSSIVDGPIVGVSIGADRKKFNLLRMIGKEAVTLKYDNCFGLTEYVSLQGILKEKPQYEFTTSIINSRTRNVAIDERKIYEFNTSAVAASTVERLKDAIRAENVMMIKDGRAFDIVFESADLAFSDDKTELQGVTFSFYRAINNRSYIENVDTEMVSRIFSDEFDDSYN